MNEKEKIVVVGFGWVGQANAVALSHMGYDVSYFDPGTPALHYLNQYPDHYDRLARLDSVLERDEERTCYIVAVGDRVSEEGTQDVSLIQGALDSLKGAKGTVVLRSTVLPEHIAAMKFHFYVPEFLHEKNAVEECLFPHFFVVGTTNTKPWPTFFEEWKKRTPKHFKGTPREASFVKYLSNLWNAVRIAFVNEFGDVIVTPDSKEELASIERVVDFVMQGQNYLKYGRSYGGHCLPKDMRAFVRFYEETGKNVSLLRGTWISNDAHAVLEKKHPMLPEWYSTWSLPHLSGTVALRELWYSIQKNILHPKPIVQRRLLGKKV